MRSSRQRLNCDSSPYRVDAASWFRLRDAVILTAAAITGFLWLGRGLPLVPLATPDTASYLQFSPIRPHGYSWLLAGYRCVFEDFAYLPHVQLGLFVAALLSLAIAIAQRIRSVALSATMLFLIIAGLEATDFIERPGAVGGAVGGAELIE